MKQADNIKDFRKIFFSDLSSTLAKEGFLYKSSKDLFERKVGEHIFHIYIYMYKRSAFIEVDTQIYYGNQLIEKELKETNVKILNDLICGGNVKFICEYYFKKDFPTIDENLFYDFNCSIEDVFLTWMQYYEDYMKPYLEDCTDPKILNKIVNEERFDTTGMNLTYENRVLKFYFVGKRSGLSNTALKELAGNYEARMIKSNASYLGKFRGLMNQVL